MAFIYKNDEVIAEYPLKHMNLLKPEYTFLCAGAGLQKLNKQIKKARFVSCT